MVTSSPPSEVTRIVTNFGSIGSLKTSATSGGEADNVAPSDGLVRTSFAWACAGRTPARSIGSMAHSTRRTRIGVERTGDTGVVVTRPSCPMGTTCHTGAPWEV